MTRKKKLLLSIINNPSQVRFSDLLAVALWLGFSMDRVSGSHHILIHKQGRVMINFQKVGDQAKPYQVRQFLKLIEEHHLSPQEADDE